MAFIKELTVNMYGEDLKFINAYHRIEYLERNVDDISIKLVSYKDDSKLHCIGTREFHFKLDYGHQNTIENAYTYLKTTSEFANVVDC